MIGYYVHHHGRGHLARATSICAHLRSSVTLLSSLAIPDHGLGGSVLLPRDDSSTVFRDPTANETLHWAPLYDTGFSERMRLIADWVADVRPATVVVDVSVEVAMFVRLLGVPVVVMAMPGDRIDGPHDLAYRIADHIVAAWPRELYEPPWLKAHSAKTTYVGGISRFDGRPRAAVPSERRPNVLVLDGAGGSNFDAATVRRCAAAYPHWRWSALGVPGGPWSDDPWPDLCAADLVISSAGQSSIADLAAARSPAIVIAAQRPFGEQGATSNALERGGMAVVRHSWPELADWPALFDRAQALGCHAWERWQTRGAAARAATVIEEVAARRPAGGPQ
jgi:UDP-N-acetylglucosamine--N-acetylmuramyl-(pentapeptide) pyrophosphoryl-undecaprenol N-acetylglucosamine transferase